MCLVSKCIIIILQRGLGPPVPFHTPPHLCLSQRSTHRPSTAGSFPPSSGSFTKRQFIYFSLSLVFLSGGKIKNSSHLIRINEVALLREASVPSPPARPANSQSHLSPHTFFRWGEFTSDNNGRCLRYHFYWTSVVNVLQWRLAPSPRLEDRGLDPRAWGLSVCCLHVLPVHPARAWVLSQYFGFQRQCTRGGLGTLNWP